ncbi:MAG: hypothetical protein IT280_00280 [Ignavibacteria bacterium]|nr:hypothetical protein [Ignavibacteria bacterium]
MKVILFVIFIAFISISCSIEQSQKAIVYYPYAKGQIDILYLKHGVQIYDCFPSGEPAFAPSYKTFTYMRPY